MENPSPQSKKRSSILLSVNLFAVLILVAACKLSPLKIDPCGVLPGSPIDTSYCHAVPLNQPDKPEYDRPVKAMDICVTADEYAQIQKSYREILNRCGDRCK